MTANMVMSRQSALAPVSGWDAVKLVLAAVFLGLWEFARCAVQRFWKGRRSKSETQQDTPVQLVDSSVGTHCYIKVMGAKYHYVETGPKTGSLVVLLGDAPGGGVSTAAAWGPLISHLALRGRRVVALDIRGTGGSEGGTRRELAPPRAMRELYTLLRTLGASPTSPVTLLGHGIGGMLTWYLAHQCGNIISRFVIVGTPHPNLYWQYPPAQFCQNILHFIQWPWVPEGWLAGTGAGAGGGEGAELLRWAGGRARDWSGALHYARGAAWWQVRPGLLAAPPALLIGSESDSGAGALVASGAWCARPALRLLPHLHPALPASSPGLLLLIREFLTEEDPPSEGECGTEARGGARGGLVGRMLGAVAGRGRELSAAAVSRASSLLASPLPQHIHA